MIKKNKDWIVFAAIVIIILMLAYSVGNELKNRDFTFEDQARNTLISLIILMVAGAFFAFFSGTRLADNNKWGKAVPPPDYLPNFQIFTTVKILGQDLFIIKLKGMEDTEGKIFKLDEKVKGRELLKEGEDFIYVGGTIFSPPPEIKL